MNLFILICIIVVIFYILNFYILNVYINCNEKFNNMYNLVIGAPFKNEAHILDEWIKHYKYHGVDHIYLINDGSTDNFEAVLEPYIKEGYVTLFNNTMNIDGYPRQKFLYEEYFKPIINNSKWWAILDLDEFMYSPYEIDLKKVIEKYNNYEQLYIKWRMFGSNGHIEQPKYVVPSFTKRQHDNPDINGKSIFRSDLLNNFDVHYHDVNGEIIVIDNDIIINHYAIQSWSFFERVKMTRGDVNNFVQQIGIVRDKKYFDEFDYKDVDDNILAKQNETLYINKII